MADQPAPAHSGLFTTNASPVPLAGVAIEGEISNFCARVAVTQRYVNRETHPIEAVYAFPLDEGAAVCGFEAIIDGTLVVGEVKERDEAFRTYDDAMERGDGGFLLDEERPDVFQASIGNLPPGKEVLVKLTYVTELAVSGRGLRFSIPTTVSPRYAPAEDRAAVGRSDAEALNPPRAWKVPYGLDISLRLSMTGTISRLESPSHPISVSMNGPGASVTLSTRETALDRDFVLSIDADGLDRPQGWAEQDDDGASAMAVAFVPDLGSGASPSDITFLVDRSGSMQGGSINEVRNALQLCLRSLVAGCRFNIIGFGSTFQPLFPTSRAYDDASLAEASTHVTALKADLGGTEILPALKFVLEQPAGTHTRQVVVLTDGEVTNTDAVLALAKTHAATARIFTFGIGAGASHHLVNGLARAGGGAAEFIFPGERIEPKVVRQVGRLLSPALTNVSVDWSAAGVKPATSAIPPIFSGSRLLVYAFGATAAASTIRLTADGPKGPLSFDVAMDASHTTRGRTVATLAARARIRELEESPEWLGLRGSRQTGRKTGAARQEIIALATRYGLLSRETSFVAIERRETPVEGQMQLRRVPIAITSGWGGQDVEQTGASRITGMAIAQLAAPTWSAGVEDTWSAERVSADSAPQARSRSPLWRVSESAQHLLTKFGHGEDERAPGRSAPTPMPAPMHRLVALQHADGSWELTSALAVAMGQTLLQLEEPIVGAIGMRDDIQRAWATALALAWLRVHASDAESEWRLLAAKAERYLAGIVARAPGGGGWIDVATNFLETWNARRPAGSSAGA